MIQKSQKRAGGELVIIERGFVKRDDFYMVGRGNINGQATYPHDLSVQEDRWEALGVHLQPWKEGDEILVIGQVPWDTACQHEDQTIWVHKACKILRQVYPRNKLVFRPHPLQPDAIKKCPDIDRVDKKRLLDEALACAKLVATFSSTVGVDATIAGVPVIACDLMSMVHKLCVNDLKEQPTKPSRFLWSRWLAYCQWTLAEMAQGLPWRHLHA